MNDLVTLCCLLAFWWAFFALRVQSKELKELLLILIERFTIIAHRTSDHFNQNSCISWFFLYTTFNIFVVFLPPCFGMLYLIHKISITKYLFAVVKNLPFRTILTVLSNDFINIWACYLTESPKLITTFLIEIMWRSILLRDKL